MPQKTRLCAIALCILLMTAGCAGRFSSPQKPTPSPVGGVERTRFTDGEEIIAKVTADVISSVVGISTSRYMEGDTFQDGKVIEGIGSGVVVDSRGYILTNDHVAGGGPESLTVIFYDGKERDGQTVWSDPAMDLAVVKINGDDTYDAAPLGASADLRIGQTVLAIGTPLGLQFQHTVTAGIISALNRTVQVPTEMGENFMEDLIQTDASINPGNSGGPLIGLDGTVVGINTIKVNTAEGIGFAIPIDVAAPVVGHIRRDGTYETPYLGVVGYDKEIACYYNQCEDLMSGVYVGELDPRGPAAKSGVRKGDVITRIDGGPITKMWEMRKAVYSHKVGETMALSVHRNGLDQEVAVALEAKPME